MNFAHWFENQDFRSKKFGKSAAAWMGQRNIQTDGAIEIDWRESEYDEENKRILAHYKIYNIDGKLVKSGAVNYYHFPDVLVDYIVMEIAKSLKIYHPTNLLLVNGEFRAAGSAQPTFDENKVKKYWQHIKTYLP